MRRGRRVDEFVRVRAKRRVRCVGVGPRYCNFYCWFIDLYLVTRLIPGGREGKGGV